MQETGSNLFTNNSLSIRLSAGGFSFFRPVGRQDFTAETGVPLAQTLDMAIRRHLRNTNFQPVRLLVDSPSTRVPIDEFRSRDAQALYQLTYGLDHLPERHEIRYEVSGPLEMAEIFTVDSDALSVVQSHFPQATVRSFYGQLLTEAFTTECHRPADCQRLYVSVAGSLLFLFAFKEGKLIFANNYDTDVTENRLYFVLSVWKMLALDQHADQCLLCGEDHDLEQALRKFLVKVTCV
ncbi:MAG: DUF3822 family protein [Bacteroidaceae bacterium]|nr:DUF3822 family protein [Bacteroidaceae bacterium]